MRFRLSPDPAGIGKGLDIIKEILTKYGLDTKQISKSMLVAEEVMTALLAHAENADAIHLSIRRVLESVSMDVTVAGHAFPFEKNLDLGTPLEIDDIGPDAELTIRNMILRSVVDDLTYRSSNGMNRVRITVVRSKRTMLYRVLGAMMLAVALGILLRFFVPHTFCSALDVGVLIPVKTMFMNALKMIVTPVVFFSIVSCIGQFSNLSEIGKIGSRIIASYFATTLIATFLGVGMFYLFQPGGMITASAAAGAEAYTAQAPDISIKDLIVGIVPDNVIKPFLETNMLQLIFLAVICGIAVTMLGKHAKVLSDLFAACNELFLKITAILVRFMPIAVFCSILSMMLNMGTKTLFSIAGIYAVFLLALLAMMGIYCILMLTLSRINPLILLKKYAPTMAQVFSMSSSNAALPLNMDACKKLGISSKIFSLSLPLGATINMDGMCLYLGVVALALAKIYGVAIPPAALLSVVIAIIVLSVGAPAVPGSGLICLSVLLTQLGVPVEAIGLIMGIDPLFGMVRAMSNCLGDVVISCIVAKQENLLDLQVYRQDA